MIYVTGAYRGEQRKGAAGFLRKCIWAEKVRGKRPPYTQLIIKQVSRLGVGVGGREENDEKSSHLK